MAEDLHTPEDQLAGQLAERMILAMREPEPFKVLARWIINDLLPKPARATVAPGEVPALALCEQEKEKQQETIIGLRRQVNDLADKLARQANEIEDRARALADKLNVEQRERLVFADRLVGVVEERYRTEDY